MDIGDRCNAFAPQSSCSPVVSILHNLSIAMKFSVFTLTCYAYVLTCRTIAFPMMDDGSVPQTDAEETNATVVASDDDISWYKPIAVILKPATEKDLEERLLSPSTRIDNDDDVSSLNYHPAVPFQRPPVLPWPYGSSPWAPPHFSRNIHDQHQQPKDRLKNYYASLNLPARIQGNLLSLARMGLVAIPKKEIGDQDKENGDDPKDLQSRVNFRQGEEVKVGEVLSQDAKSHYHHHHKHNHRKYKNQWVHNLVGSPGPQGPVGPAGKDGGNGINGLNGVDGQDGKDGAQGPVGPQGPQGLAGPPGRHGVNGAPGPQGPSGAPGIQGVQGIQGNTGPQGIQGDTGEPGVNGKDGLNGLNGKDGVAGPAGPIGPPGVTGQDGKDGKDGAAGPQGPPGPSGVAGQNGKDGVDGKDGKDGTPGAAGPPGPSGADGADGSSGSPGTPGKDGQDGAAGVAGVAGPPGSVGTAGAGGAAGMPGTPGTPGSPGVPVGRSVKTKITAAPSDGR